MNMISHRPQLKLEGRSGCLLEIYGEGRNYFVKKHSNSADYNTRLAKQMEKQRDFVSESSDLEYFAVPEVVDHAIDDNSGLMWFSMDYVSGAKATDFLAKADAQSLKILSSKFEDYFKYLESHSEVMEAPMEVIDRKIDSLSTNLSAKKEISTKLASRLEDYLRIAKPQEQLLIGKCHGDFTLSNILFGQDKLYLLDFLDSFIESPLIDIVKLRQDTKFRWSLMIDKELEDHKIGRAGIALTYLDEAIWKYVNSNKMYRNWYPYLEVFNLARILPYLKEKKEIDFIQNHLSDLIN